MFFQVSVGVHPREVELGYEQAERMAAALSEPNPLTRTPHRTRVAYSVGCAVSSRPAVPTATPTLTRCVPQV
jgi:hypothetical protein